MGITSDFNLQTINTKELTSNLAATIEFGGSLFAVARRGTGKTSITHQVINDLGYKPVYLNLSLMERPDLGGYPSLFNLKDNQRFINFLMPAFYQALMEGDQPCVAILDEMDKAESGLLAPLLEFVQERTVNGHKLKNLHAIVMLGNLPGEGGSRPPLPLLDRAEKFLVEINPLHWLEWGATSKEIHASVSAYIADNMSDLCGEVDIGENFSSESPRSWHNASKLVTYGERHSWGSQLIMQKVAACVGKRVSAKYAAFFEHYQVLLPTVDRILQGEKTLEFSGFEETKKLMIAMILAGRFATMLDEIKLKSKAKTPGLSKDQHKISQRTAGFFVDYVDPEVAMIAIRGQIGAKRVLDFDLLEDSSWQPLIASLLKKLG